MMGRTSAVLLGVSIILSLPATCRAGDLDEPPTQQTIEAPQPSQGPVAVVRPGCSPGDASVHPYVVPSYRPHRRGPLPATLGVYIGPQTYYAGFLAPWGSIPAAYYAASVPLPQLAARPGEYTGSLYDPGATADRPQAERNPEPSPVAPPPPPRDSVAFPETTEPTPGPEAIPAPQPMEVANPSGLLPNRGGGLINPPPRTKPERPSVRIAPTRPQSSGPREF